MGPGCFQPVELNMELKNYLLHALLIAACIPVLDVVATWYYARGVRRRNKLAMDLAADRNNASAGVAAPQSGMPAPPAVLAALPADTAAHLQRLGIGFDGRQFRYAGYAYDRAADAVAYAELVLTRSNALRDELLGQRPVPVNPPAR